jgi:undecaprenyl-diphosphatase
MPLYQVIILAVIQGVTEFLPISSTAHLALAPWLFGWRDQTLTFDIALHLGTLAAILLYFYRDLLQILVYGLKLRRPEDSDQGAHAKLLWMIAAGTVPVAVAGLLFQHQAEDVWRLNRFLIGAMLIAVGLLMLAAEKLGRRQKDIRGVTFRDAIIIGGAQALAIVPGASRSGVTITAALFCNMDRSTAARFSFLLSTPAIAGAALKASIDLFRHGGIPADMRWPFLIGILVSALTGGLVIAFLLRFLRTHSLKFFVYYRVIFGIIVVALAAIFR